jgi:hypothetical protein
VISNSDIADFAGGLEFVTGVVAGSEIGEVFDNLDGAGRDDRIRYDTPNFSGFKGAFSLFEEDDGWDLAARYANGFDGFKLAGAVAYVDTSSIEQFAGSASVLFDMGLNVTGAVGARDVNQTGREDPFFWYLKLGYQFSPFKSGKTSLAIDFAQAKDVVANDDELTSIGIFAVQKVDRIGAEFYFGYRFHGLDVVGTDPEDINAVMIGTRIKF